MHVSFGFSLLSVLPYISYIHVVHMNTPVLFLKKKKRFHRSDGASLVHLGNAVIRSLPHFTCGPQEGKTPTLVSSGGRLNKAGVGGGDFYNFVVN